MTLFVITGGAGFVGSHLAERCLLLEHDVIVVDGVRGGHGGSGGRDDGTANQTPVMTHRLAIRDVGILQVILGSRSQGLGGESLVGQHERTGGR